MLAFLTGQPVTLKSKIEPLGKGGYTAIEREFAVINKIEREGGSNNAYNVTGITSSGKEETVFVQTTD